MVGSRLCPLALVGVCQLTTLKEFEDALREQGLNMALAVLQKLRERDRAKRSIAPARRITGRKMTPDVARQILELHATTGMTQQEIAFKLGVNQGRVNEVIKRGKWLEENPASPEAVARDRAKARMADKNSETQTKPRAAKAGPARTDKKRGRAEPAPKAQLTLGDL
jgi:hypothetical protein